MTTLSSTLSPSTLKKLLSENSHKLAELFRSSDWFLSLIPLLFPSEVRERCGTHGSHTKTKDQRWGMNPGTIRWNGAKIRVKIPRVRDTANNREVPLKTYKLLHQPEPGHEEQRTRSVLFGRSQRRYGHVATHLAETFGFRASTVGRVFIQETAKALDPFMNLMTRSLWGCSSTARPYAVSK